MVECVDEHGYVATTISELVSRARISRRSFYEHFRNKDECLLATYDTVIERLGRRLSAVQDSSASWDAQLEALHPHPIRRRRRPARRGAAGLRGDGRRRPDRSATLGGRGRAFAALHRRRIRSEPTARARSPIRSPGRSSGRCAESCTRASQRSRSSKSLRAELSELVPDLLAWITSYYPSPEGLPLRPRSRRASAIGARLGGRAPGTLSARALSGERGLPRGEHNLPRGFVTHNQRERIFDAIANLTATRGYPTLSLDEVAAEAAVSLQTFYAHFAEQGRGLRGHVRDRSRARDGGRQPDARPPEELARRRARRRGRAAGVPRLRALLRASGAAWT